MKIKEVILVLISILFWVTVLFFWIAPLFMKTAEPPDCYYTAPGCEGDNRWGQ